MLEAVKVTGVPAQIVVPGLAAMLTAAEKLGLTVTKSVCGELLPQEFPALTLMDPLELPTLTVIEVVLELPDQPGGKLQL